MDLKEIENKLKELSIDPITSKIAWGVIYTKATDKLSVAALNTENIVLGGIYFNSEQDAINAILKVTPKKESDNFLEKVFEILKSNGIINEPFDALSKYFGTTNYDSNQKVLPDYEELDLLDVVQDLIDKNGKCTSLEVKARLRELGFTATQEKVSNDLKNLLKRLDNFTVKASLDNGVAHLVYSFEDGNDN